MHIKGLETAPNKHENTLIVMKQSNDFSEYLIDTVLTKHASLV